MLKDFVSTNIWSILTLIFVAGGAYSMLMSHENSINDLELKILEIEENKVSKSSLELQRETLTHQLNTLQSEIESTNGRVRRKIDGDIKKCLDLTNANNLSNVDHEARLSQAEKELNNLWKFTNKFLEKIK